MSSSVIGPEYWCHRCRDAVHLLSGDLICPRCDECFIESLPDLNSRRHQERFPPGGRRLLRLFQYPDGGDLLARRWRRAFSRDEDEDGESGESEYYDVEEGGAEEGGAEEGGGGTELSETSTQRTQQIEEALKLHWKYFNRIWIIYGTSLAYFGLDVAAHGWLSLLQVEISLLIVCTLLVVSLYPAYQKISEERQLRMSNVGEHAATTSICYQVFLFVLTVCLLLITYISIGLRAILQRKKSMTDV